MPTLGQAVAFLNGLLPLDPYQLDGEPYATSAVASPLDFADVKGQEAVKRAITIAAAGGHNLLMVGPPGTGKSMLAHRMAGVLPPLTRLESLETTRIYSALGLLPDGIALMDQRPVRTPHHSATAQALVGGGQQPAAGRGVAGPPRHPVPGRAARVPAARAGDAAAAVGGAATSTVARVSGSCKFPAKFMLVAAMNPTASGYAADNPGPGTSTWPSSRARCWTGSTSTSRCRPCRTRS